MINFTDYILSRSYTYEQGTVPHSLIKKAEHLCVQDVLYHYDLSQTIVTERIKANANELAIYLYRLGSLVFNEDLADKMLRHIHWAMREVCGCEIYFSTEIEEGFYISHGLGTVIGSRNKIGKGFRIYQGCTIGHTKDKGTGCVIGNDVTLYANAQILGELTIGDNAVIGSNSLVLKDMPAKHIAKGSPATFTPLKRV